MFGSRITFEALWEGNISFELRHIGIIETNVSKNLFGLSSHIIKI